MIYEEYKHLFTNNLNFKQFKDDGGYRDIIDMNCYDLIGIENIMSINNFYLNRFKVTMFFIDSDMYYLASMIVRFDKILIDAIINESLNKKMYELRIELLKGKRINAIKRGHFLAYKYMYENNVQWKEMQKIIDRYNKLLHVSTIFDLNTHTQDSTPEGLLFSILPGFFTYAVLHNEPLEKHKNFNRYMDIIKARKAELIIFTNLDIDTAKNIYTGNIIQQGKYVIIN